MYKSNKNLLLKDVQSFFILIYGHVLTRQTGNFQQLNVKPTKKTNVYFYRWTKLCNSMETILREETSIHMFVKKFTKLLWNLAEKICIDLLLICGTTLMSGFS